mmetsp:Transcript_106231/g.298748  ORF Transcript_106231/g.298748 Transcript_106231/m.298748 type:complete len:720 (-) Transcript_106231:138-2297(-)|eukprot:CAMPEP_0117502078 /NCGR_PEP_ID=MMETSP0784-20121206/23628_1 /TAXON_ID=39447 /ORGANISM="" /LENGTH=719 /DNA_ID=CAMNT_0005297351 /DNA_START=84 /DNA_END=2243 /DNA_ORIENTATION=-
MPQMQWSKPVVADLRRERRGATFDIWDLSIAIYGGEEAFANVERQTRMVMNEPRLATDDLWWMSRKERYVRACERGELFVKFVREHNIPFEERYPLELLLGEDLFILLHDVMFAPTLMNLADDEQQSWWLQKALNYDILGTYAQTELTHGSNVRGIKTTAVYDETLFEDGGWHVHTPSLEAMKWWPGGLAKSCNCCILMARVIVKGKDYGPHPFFFQVRDWNTHESLPGIELRDIGQKLGYNGMDNGGMRITNVKIPRRNLLMRFVVVDKDGTYRKVGDDKMLFGTMTYTRLKISNMSGFNLAKACTTAIRYSAVRRQFQMQRVVLGTDIESADRESASPQEQLNNLVKPSKRSEAQVLDYSSQQYILFPQLALAYAMHFAGQAVHRFYDKAIVEFRAGKFDALTEMHVATSTLKAVSTVLMADGMEQCRKCLGGHGFLNAAGVGPQLLGALPQATYEGDFVVLSIQVGQQLLNAVSAKMMKNRKSNPKTPLLQYIYDFDPMKPREPPPADSIEGLLKDPAFLVSCLKLRANFLHYSAAQAFQEEVAAQGKVDASTIDVVKIEFMRMTHAHAYVLYAGLFAERLKEIEVSYPKVASVLHLLFELFCLTVLDCSYDKAGGFGEFVAAGALPPAAYGPILKRQKQLLREIRPHAVPLVDGWNIPDFLLNSCLGRYDGRVYESLYEQTKYEPLNESDVSEGYYKHLQYILHPERKRDATSKL